MCKYFRNSCSKRKKAARKKKEKKKARIFFRGKKTPTLLHPKPAVFGLFLEEREKDTAEKKLNVQKTVKRDGVSISLAPTLLECQLT